MGTAEVVRTHAAQDTHCGIGRSQPPTGPQHPVPQIMSFFASIAILEFVYPA